jgi:hypothetical protein
LTHLKISNKNRDRAAQISNKNRDRAGQILNKNNDRDTKETPGADTLKPSWSA